MPQTSEAGQTAVEIGNSPGAVIVREFVEQDAAEWDRFVFAHACGSPFHLIAWKKTIERVFRYRAIYLVAMRGGRIRGVLPLFLVKSFLSGRVLISSPFAVYGGILADSDETKAVLAAHLRTLARSMRVQYVELRNAYPEQCSGFETVSRYVTFTGPIAESEAAILDAIPRKTRRMVRKSLDAHYLVRTQLEDDRVFEDLYSRNLRRLGTPSFPREYFGVLLANFRGAVDIREVWLNGEPAAAVLSFYFRDRVLPYYGASDPAFNEHAPNNFMYFDLMRWAGAHGHRVFDFGRSKKESGSYDFKAHWGFTAVELPYEVLLVRRKSLPNYSPNNPRFAAVIRIWSRLPLRLTRALGPRLIRQVP